MSVSESNNNIRIRTTPLGSDKYVKINLNQKFDFLEILSLKIGQEQVYKQYCSDYGVIAGRVVVNGGVGVPNAKVSVFIPISDEDKERPSIRALYPYETTESVDFNNIKYNLLLEAPRQDDICHRTVGTFPEKRRILDCNPWCEVYGKYYKYTTSTNASGDYMIFGVPTGVQTVHMDVDLSDMGYLSQKPYDMVSQGSPETMFDSLNQFKTSPNLAQLPQIKTQNKTINVAPFWGDLEQCEVGVNRVDFDLNYKIIPSAFFIGSIFGDSNKNAVSKRCRPRPDLGLNNQFNVGEGTIQSIRLTPNGGTEVFDINGGRVIDEDGTWVVQVPMNLETKITDEFGNLIDSENPQIGIATKAKYRFKIGMNGGGALGRIRTRGKFLVPNYGNYTFDDTTPEFITVNGITYPNFAEMEWNGVYTVKEFISRYSKRAGLSAKSYTGIKDVGNAGNVNPFPYNSMSQDVDFLFIFLCLIAQILGSIIVVVNTLISVWNGFLQSLINISILGVSPFGFLSGLQVGCINLTLPNNGSYCPGCFQNKDNSPWCNDDAGDFFDAITNELAVAFDIFKFNFIEDWINGTLFAFSFKLKDKPNGRSKFCNVDGGGYGSNYVSSFNCGSSKYDPRTVTALSEGVIKYFEGEYFYAAIDRTLNWLYPTDIYNLGSMKSCDVMGKPKIVTDIPPTTFNLPSEDFTILDCDFNGNNCYTEIGTDNFLIEINCFGTKSNRSQCKNQRRFCELGVDYDDDQGLHDELNDLDISDIPTFGPALLRANLECLNVPSICTNCTTPPEGQFTNDWKLYRTGNLLNSGNLGYTEDNIIFYYQNELIRNSFYFYFGAVPGKTAMDKLVSQYFAPCERSEPCPIFISGTVVNNTCISGNTGSITASPKYGTPPYKYDWYLGFYTFGGNNIPFSLDGGPTINNLYSDIYTVVVTDRVGNICKKSFSVLDPTPFSVVIDYSQYVCPGANNGYIYVTPVGGIPPYTIDWSLGADITQYNTGNTNNSFFITGLGPTSLCNNSGIGGGFGGSAPQGLSFNSTLTNPINFTVIENSNLSNQFVTNVQYNNIIQNSTNFVNANVNVNGQPIPTSTYYVSADGTYLFNVSLNGVYTQNEFPNNTNTNLRVTLVLKQYRGSTNNLISSTNIGTILLNQNNTSGSINFSNTANLNVLTGDFVRLELIYTTSGIPVNSQTNVDVTFVFNNGQFTSPIQILNNSGGGAGGGNALTNFYNAIIWDSGGNCRSLSAFTIDITQSCGLTLTATSVNDYCSGTSKSSITLSVGGGGVPPFTYIIQSNDANYFWSGTSTENTITRNRVIGGPICKGYTYTATTIDSCGSVDTKKVQVTKGNLRYLGGATFEYPQYYYYVRVFAGFAPFDMYTYVATPGGSQTMYSGGPNKCINPPLANNPATWWYQLLPGGYVVYCFKDSTTNDYMNVFRNSYNSDYDIISFDVDNSRSSIWRNYLGPNQLPGSPLNYSSSDGYDFLVCKNEIVSFIVGYGGGGAQLSYSIKTQGCSDKISGTI